MWYGELFECKKYKVFFKTQLRFQDFSHDANKIVQQFVFLLNVMHILHTNNVQHKNENTIFLDNIYLNKNGGQMSYFQLIPFVLIKMNHKSFRF